MKYLSLIISCLALGVVVYNQFQLNKLKCSPDIKYVSYQLVKDEPIVYKFNSNESEKGVNILFAMDILLENGNVWKGYTILNDHTGEVPEENVIINNYLKTHTFPDTIKSINIVHNKEFKSLEALLKFKDHWLVKTE